MRISDWSSDVCSSDLGATGRGAGGARGRTVSQPGTAPAQGRADAAVDWARVRGDFPLLRREVNGKPLVYFDSANTGQKPAAVIERSEEHTSELQSLMRSSYAVFCLKKKKK